jgi:gluconolactonase
VWVNGQLPRDFGQSGGSVIKGFNAPNRLVIAQNAQPGQKIQIAVFGINGPISDAPGNFIFFRYARVEVYQSLPGRRRGVR